MKRCPACSRVYDDASLRFCLDDGTELVNKPVGTDAPQTLAMPAVAENQPTIKAFQPPPPPPAPPSTVSAFKSKRQRNIIVWILVLGLGLPFIAGAVAAGWMIFHKPAVTWHLVLEVDPATPDRAAVVTQAVTILNRRLDALGLRNFEVKPYPDSSSGRIIVRLPTVSDPDRIKRIVTTLGKLELVHVISTPNPAPVQTYSTKDEALAAADDPTSRRALPYVERDDPSASSAVATRWVLVETPAIVSGSSIRDASPVEGVRDNYQIHFTLSATGAKRFAAWTGSNINQYLGIVLNDEVKSIPYIKSQISDTGQIDGRYTRQSAEDLALVLKAGALPAPLKLVEEGTIK
jgi:protein-export membrane protein SecD